MSKTTITLAKTDIHDGLLVAKGVPKDEKQRTNEVQKLRNAAKRKGMKVHDRKSLGVFVATSKAASEALSEAHPITRTRKGGLDLDQLIADAS